jgi:hypothetical protein
MQKKHLHKFISVITLFFLFACSSEKVPDENVIATVADKSISVNEYIRRAEYTIRPPYCRTNNYIHRKIVLNSLIAEKLMAIEAGEDNELTNNEDINLYLQGRKEQSMRQWHFNEDMYSQVEVDTQEMKKVYRVAGKKFDIEYVSFTSPQLSLLIDQALDEGETDIKNIYQQLGGEGDVPNRSIGFNDPEPDRIHDALFSDTLQIGQFVGPLKIDNNNFILMQIKGGTNSIAITNNQIKERWDGVRTKLIEKKANIRFDQYVKDLMAGKTINFEKNTFEVLVKVLGQEYYRTEKEKKEAFNQKIWNKDNPQVILDELSYQLEEMMDQPLFRIDDQVWTVRMLRREIKIHPLVFRKHKMPKSEFAEQLKLAIVDMIRDKYITEEAYDKGFDQVPEVVRNQSMWKDNLLALYHKEQYLKKFDIPNRDQMNVITEYLNPYIKKLYDKYGDRIRINTDDFEKVNLTSVDMFVIQTNVPYPVIVPSFPQLTTHDKLDYGTKME